MQNNQSPVLKKKLLYLFFYSCIAFLITKTIAPAFPALSASEKRQLASLYDTPDESQKENSSPEKEQMEEELTDKIPGHFHLSFFPAVSTKPVGWHSCRLPSICREIPVPPPECGCTLL